MPVPIEVRVKRSHVSFCNLMLPISILIKIKLNPVYHHGELYASAETLFSMDVLPSRDGAAVTADDSTPKAVFSSPLSGTMHL